jgi:choline dehydrogenase-like flavoprotein
MFANHQTDYDYIIIGTGVGGGTLAYALRDSGARILLIERGDYLPQEPENWMPEAVFDQGRHKPAEMWYDDRGQRSKFGRAYWSGDAYTG